MKRWLFPLALAGLSMASRIPVRESAKTFTGVIWDNRCSDGTCATQCPISKIPKYTLQTDTSAWVLSDQKMPSKYVGKKVVVTGTLSGGNQLKVNSIVPAK